MNQPTPQHCTVYRNGLHRIRRADRLGAPGCVCGVHERLVDRLRESK